MKDFQEWQTEQQNTGVCLSMTIRLFKNSKGTKWVKTINFSDITMIVLTKLKTNTHNNTIKNLKWWLQIKTWFIYGFKL